MNFKTTFVFSLVAAVFSASTVAQTPVAAPDSTPASSTEGTVQLDPLVILGERGESLTIPTADAARAEIRLTPGGVEVIEADRYLRGRASTVEDTFALSPGVIAQSRFGSDEARLSIRGSGIQRTFHGRGLRILQDGAPLNLADGGFDMQAFEPLSAAYINVWRGGNALAYGGSTLGGAIEYVSRTGRNRDTPAAFTRLEAGSWDYLRASIAGGGSRDRLDGFASFTHQSQDGFRDHAKQSNQRLFANGGLRVSDRVETRVFLTLVRTDSELPGSLTKAQLRANPRQAAAGNIALDQKRDFELARLTSRTTVQTGPTLWDFTAGWTWKDLDHPIFQVIDQLSNDVVVSATATHVGEIGGRSHRLRGGVFLTHGLTHAKNFVNVAGRRGALVSNADQTASNLEAFVEDQLRLTPEFTLVYGAGASSNRRENERITGGAPDYTVDYSRLLPKLGLRWNRGEVELYGNVSTSYEPPSFSEALTLNRARDAQTATTFEIGTRGSRGPVRWDATLYHARIDRELLTIDDDNNPSTPSATVNADRTTHTGVELACEIDLLRAAGPAARTGEHHLVARGAWTYGRFKFHDDARYGNNTLAGLPPHVIRGELTWEHASGWYAGPTIEWVPVKTYIDQRNTFAADPYAIFGLRVGQRRARGLSWFVEARNLGDKIYTATTGVIETAAGRDQPQFLPGDGRSFFAGAELKW